MRTRILETAFAPHLNSLRLLSLAMILTSTIALGACSHERPDLSVAGPSEAQYECTGVIKSIKADPKDPTIGIEHDEIKGLMPAKTTEFQVPGKGMLEGLKAGDRIRFTLEKWPNTLQITSIGIRRS